MCVCVCAWLWCLCSERGYPDCYICGCKGKVWPTKNVCRHKGIISAMCIVIMNTWDAEHCVQVGITDSVQDGNGFQVQTELHSHVVGVVQGLVMYSICLVFLVQDLGWVIMLLSFLGALLCEGVHCYLPPSVIWLFIRHALDQIMLSIEDVWVCQQNSTSYINYGFSTARQQYSLALLVWNKMGS